MNIQKESHCNICDKFAIVKEKNINNKIYKNICEECFYKIKKKNLERTEKLNKRLSSRKNYKNICDNTIPPLFLRDYKTAEYYKILKKIKLEDTLFLHSKTAGTGKSTLAIQILKNFIWRGFEGVFITAPALLLELRSCFDSGESEQEKINYYSKVDLLILDDLGTEKLTEYAEMVLYVIIDKRYSYLKKTIITSNFNLKELSEKLNNRIASRLASGIVYKLDAKDYRLNKLTN